MITELGSVNAELGKLVQEQLETKTESEPSAPNVSQLEQQKSQVQISSQTEEMLTLERSLGNTCNKL